MPFQRRPRRKAARKPAASGRRRRPAAGARKSRPVRRARNVRSSNTTIRQQNLGQQTESTVMLKHGAPDSRARVMKAVGTSNQWVYTSSDTISTVGTPGRQAWQWSSIADIKDLRDIGDKLAPRSAGSQTPPARYLLQKCQHNMKFSNLGQANVKLTILHVRNKRDTGVINNYTSPNGFSYDWAGDPNDAIRQGIQAANQGPLTGGVIYLIPGVDETESPIFNSFYRILKRTEILLSVGGTHKLTNNMLYDRVLDASVYSSDQLTAVMGVTDYIVMKAEGQTGVLAAEDPPRVTIAPCQVAYTENFDYTFVQVQNSKRFLDVTDNITAAGAAVTVISGATGSGVLATGLIS